MQVHCQFKHIPSKRDGEQLAANIETFVRTKTFDKNGIKNCGENGNDTICFTLSRADADSLRDQIDVVLPNDSSPIWFTILTDPLNDRPTQSVLNAEDALHQGSTFNVTCQFGSLRSYSQFYSHVPFDNQYVKISFKPARTPNSLYIEFDHKRIIIPFTSIQKRNILINQKHKNGVYVLLSLKFPPSVYRLESVTTGNNANTNTKEVRICADEQDVKFINELAHCSDLVIHFPPSQNMARSFLNHFLMHHPEHYHINFSTFKISDWSNQNLKKKNQRPDPFNFSRASFQDRYALQILTSLGFLFRDKWAQLTDEELNWDKWNPDERYSLCCFAAEQLRKDHGYDLTRTKKDYETRKKEDKLDSNKNEQAVLVENRQRLKVATCTLTPLKIIFQPFEVTAGSRALRNQQFGGVERFLLVHFREEDNQQLRTSSTTIKQRLKKSMSSGIDLFKRTFKYMGASTGQMKEKAFWFIDLPPKLNNMLDAHKVLGDFDDIKNIATYIARVGQYFSTTWSVEIQLVEVNKKTDIRPNTGQNYVFIDDDVIMNKYCFTDGIGKISWGLAGRIAQKMNLPLFRKEDIPSAFQVRVAGCKGMLAIDPQSTFDDYYIHVRPSMVKFKCNDWSLEICEYARPITLTLNNQVIRLLSDLGNPDSAFIALQNRGLTQWSIPEEQQPSAIDIAVQRNVAYSLSTDNLLTNRIPIPLEEGRNLFGVADESRELKYGECFIQYSILNSTNNSQRKFKVVTGTVIVTKNPCLWPGDFRKLTAVCNSKLEECMRDVIVFPIDGPRPHSNEIAGSDLDGDQYWVYWGDRLKIANEVAPLSYEGVKKKEEPSINQETIITHIVESFAAGVILGMIANTHIVVADRHDEHSHSKDCRQLAELFSLAVDSPKTGHFIDKKDIRRFQARYCKQGWPKFMRKYGEPSYESNSVLEQLFSKAEEKFYEWKDAPLIKTFPQGIKSIKGAPVVEIKDPNFKKYLEGDTSKAVTPKGSASAKPPETTDDSSQTKVKKTGKKQLEENMTGSETALNTKIKQKSPAKPSETTDDNSQPEAKKNAKKPPEDNTTGSDTTAKPEAASNPKAKKSTTAENSKPLTNSNPTASATSSLSSLSSLNIDQSQPDFLMAVEAKTMTSSNVQVLPAKGGSYIVSLASGTTGSPNREKIIDKLRLYMDKLDVFKKKSNPYNETTHGPLYLMIFYGNIYFVEQDLPLKLGDLQALIKSNSGQRIHFNHADIDELDIRSLSPSTTKKNKIDYEFDCCLTASSSEYYSLLYDNKKTLKQIRVYRTWSKCYVRQPNFNVDSLYEIRSTITHELHSPEFDRIANLVLRTQSTGLLSGTKPRIEIDHAILHPEVIAISLKVIEGDYQLATDFSTIDTFYRKVKNVSIDKQQEKPTVLSTLEYHASPIIKDDDILNRVCEDGLAPAKESS